MASKIVNRERLELKEKPRLLSPPIISEPLYQCAIAITVFAYEPDAKIELEIDGAALPAVPGGFPLPDGVTIPVAALVKDQKVRARQTTSSAQSDWTGIVTVRDHTEDYPAGPPRPQINPAPVYECGVRTGVGNVLTGGNVWITADGSEVGRVNGCKEQQGVNVTPTYGFGQKVRAWFELCKDPSPPSIEYTTIKPPSPPPAPTFATVYEGARQVTVGNIVNGAKVTLYRDNILLGTWPCWGDRITIDVAIVGAGQHFTASQSMCPGDPTSPPGDTTVQPCSSLPAPEVGPVQAGDDRITLTQFVSDAVIKVFINGVQVGASGGPVVLLTQRVARGDTVVVVQDLVGCESQYALEITVGCVDPPISANPAWLDLFPVGSLEYASGGIKGSVYYPAEDDGNNQPFNQRLAALGRSPIVFMAHGNHSPGDPSYLGYDYFQHDLAKMGIIAVSVDCNALNGAGSGVQNIEDRADLIIDNIAHFQGLDTDPASVFLGHIDFNRTGLMGHSRGGDAVVVVPSVISLAGVTIKSALALAPTNFRFWAGMPTIRPTGHAFMTILPAGDGDVVDNNGAQFYDQAAPGPFKSQLYIHYTNHNFFNRQWAYNDSLNYTQPPVIARFDHERILSAYGCALFRATLLGHNTRGYLAEYRLPAGVMHQHVYPSYEREKVTIVDNHEDGNTINKNSLGEPTSQLAGMSADEYQHAHTGLAYNTSFYGESMGMVCKPGRPGRVFRSALKGTVNLSKAEIWIRAAEVTDGSNVPGGATGFKLGLEDASGVQAWVDSDEVGGLPRPYDRNPGMIKTMLKTLRFKGECFKQERGLELRKIQAILIQCDRKDERAFAYDDLQIVKSTGQEG
ncbi:MAG: hypothetical protein ABI670_09010 [Chloroflexota bacterium]